MVENELERYYDLRKQSEQAIHQMHRCCFRSLHKLSDSTRAHTMNPRIAITVYRVPSFGLENYFFNKANGELYIQVGLRGVEPVKVRQLGSEEMGALFLNETFVRSLFGVTR